MSRRRILPAALVVLLLLVTLVAAAASFHYESARADERARAGAARAATVTQFGVVNASGSLSGAAGLFDASDEVTSREFAAFAHRVLGRGALSAVGWLERVDAGERAAFEARLGSPITEIGGDGPRPAPRRDTHFPVSLFVSEINTTGVVGLDSSREPLRRAALERAAALDAPVTTAPLVLRASGVRGLIIFQPVYDGGRAPASAAGRRRALRGFVIGSFRLEDLSRRIIAAADAGVPIEIHDGETLLSAPAAGAADGARIDISVAGRRWTILAGRPRPSYALPAVILAGGAALTLLALMLAIVIARRDRFATAAVDQATEELRESRRSLRALADNSPDIVARFDRDLRCTYMSAAVLPAMGLAPAAFLGRTAAEAGAPPELAALWEQALRRAFDGEQGVEVEFSFAAPGGARHFQARLAPEPGTDRAVGHVLMVTRDVTRQTLAERALRASEDRYRVLLDSLSDGVIVQDDTGGVISCNPAAEAILGVRAEQLAGCRPTDPRWGAVHQDGTPLSADEHPALVTLRTGESEQGVVIGINRADDVLIWLSVSTRLLLDDGRRSVVCCFTDITARVEADREQAALRRVATLVAADAEPPEVLALVAQEAAALVGADAAGVVRFDDTGLRGALVGSHGGAARPTEPGALEDLDAAGVIGIVAATGEPARVGDGTSLHDCVLTPGVGASSAVAAPVRVENRLWGAIAAVTTNPGTALAPGTPGRLARLGELVSLAIVSADARAQLATLAATDHLTGLPNRRTFTESLAVEIERARRYDRNVSLVVFDIDHFKRINDTHGHPTGDRVLGELAGRLFAGVRESQLVARVGGEEFAWILPETDGAAAVAAAERLRKRVGGLTFDGVGSLTVSMGVCDLLAAGSAGEMLRLADAALYRAKAAGRDRVVRHVASRRPATAGASRPES